MSSDKGLNLDGTWGRTGKKYPKENPWNLVREMRPRTDDGRHGKSHYLTEMIDPDYYYEVLVTILYLFDINLLSVR